MLTLKTIVCHGSTYYSLILVETPPAGKDSEEMRWEYYILYYPITLQSGTGRTWILPSPPSPHTHTLVLNSIKSENPQIESSKLHLVRLSGTSSQTPSHRIPAEPSNKVFEAESGQMGSPPCHDC